MPASAWIFEHSTAIGAVNCRHAPAAPQPFLASERALGGHPACSLA